MLESPYKDKNGRIICHGDVIRFYFSADYPDLTESTEDIKLTEMIDVVDFDPETQEWVAWSDIGMGAFLWRYNDRCEVINNINNMSEKELYKIGWNFKRINYKA